MKKTVAVIVVSILLAVSMSGALAVEPATITVWGWEGANGALRLSVDEFNKLYPEITVDFVDMAYGDVNQNLLLALQSGSGAPDVSCLASSELSKFILTGGLLDVTENIAPYVDDFHPFKIADATKDGKIYAFPWDSGPVGLFYRRDVFEKAGFPSDPEGVAEVIKTWDDFVSVGLKIKETTGASMLNVAVDKPDTGLLNIMLQQQGKWVLEDDKVAVDSADSVKAVEFITKMINAGITSNVYDQAYNTALSNGELACLPGAVWNYNLISIYISPDSKGLWGVAPLPVFDISDAPTANNGGSNLVIPAQGSNLEAALLFSEFETCTAASQATMFLETGTFPSFIPALDDPRIDVKDEFFDMYYARFFAELAKQIRPVVYTADFPAINDEVVLALGRIWLDGVDIQTALTDAANTIRQKTGLE